MAFGQLLCESGQFECWEGDGKFQEGSLADMMETRKVSVVCVRDQMEGEQSEIVGEAASCSVVVQTNKSVIVWG